MYEM
jgi:hypothetical protein